jgi:hypothetical protein
MRRFKTHMTIRVVAIGLLVPLLCVLVAPFGLPGAAVAMLVTGTLLIGIYAVTIAWTARFASPMEQSAR